MKKMMNLFYVVVMLTVSILAGCGHENAASVSSGTTNTQATEPAKQKMEDTDTGTLADLTYDGKSQIITLNNNHTTFSSGDVSLSHGNWQTFSDLDRYNRVGVANAMLSKEMMPTAKRERLYVNPTGWKNKQITINGHREWLYNRCHLIGYQFTGENNNLKNLMTGTRSFNDPGMLLYENKVATYLKTTQHHVRYQVEPIFNKIATEVSLF